MSAPAGNKTRIKRGDVIASGAKGKGVVVKIGRGTARSAYVFWQTGPAGLLTEIDFWQEVGVVRFVSRVPANLRFARDYCRLNQMLPDL